MERLKNEEYKQTFQKELPSPSDRPEKPDSSKKPIYIMHVSTSYSNIFLNTICYYPVKTERPPKRHLQPSTKYSIRWQA